MKNKWDLLKQHCYSHLTAEMWDEEAIEQNNNNN